jgi:hypothetical protein
MLWTAWASSSHHAANCLGQQQPSCCELPGPAAASMPPCSLLPGAAGRDGGQHQHPTRRPHRQSPPLLRPLTCSMTAPKLVPASQPASHPARQAQQASTKGDPCAHTTVSSLASSGQCAAGGSPGSAHLRAHHLWRHVPGGALQAQVTAGQGLGVEEDSEPKVCRGSRAGQGRAAGTVSGINSAMADLSKVLCTECSSLLCCGSRWCVHQAAHARHRAACHCRFVCCTASRRVLKACLAVCSRVWDTLHNHVQMVLQPRLSAAVDPSGEEVASVRQAAYR